MKHPARVNSQGQPLSAEELSSHERSALYFHWYIRNHWKDTWVQVYVRLFRRADIPVRIPQRNRLPMMRDHGRPYRVIYLSAPEAIAGAETIGVSFRRATEDPSTWIALIKVWEKKPKGTKGTLS